MHEFESRLREWRYDLLSRGGVRAWQADELEDQLCCSLAAALHAGADAEGAWREAVEALGNTQTLHTEYTKDRLMTLTSKLAGFAITLAILGLATTGPATFLHIPTIMTVAALIMGGLITSFGWSRTKRALSASFQSASPLEAQEIDHLLPVFKRGYRLAWMSSVIGVVVAFMQLMGNLSDPSRLGEGLALVTLMVFYGAVIAEFVFANGEQWLENRRLPCE